MITNQTSLPEYYVKLDKMYETAINLLTAINQSLTTNTQEINVSFLDTDDNSQTVRIPSFLHLENKLEQISLNFNELFKIPATGEGWFSESSNMYKLMMLKSNSAPAQPSLKMIDGGAASMTENLMLKDFVCPKTYYRIKIDSLPENISSMVMKKLVIHNADHFTELQSMEDQSYQNYVEKLDTLTKGTDYDEYDSTVSLPIKKDQYLSEFQISSIPELDSGNPWTEESTSRLRYKLVLNTLQYTNSEDPSITYTLKIGDTICLGDRLCEYTVVSVDTQNNTIIAEEIIGHTTLQTYEENTSMVLKLYQNSYSEFHYIDIPLEENEYIIVFLAAIYDNVRSSFSDGVALNLNTIYMKDEGGNYILDSYGNKLTYMDYYNKYCVNVGDLILGLTQTAYPQVSNYSASVLKNLQEGTDLISILNASVVPDDNIQVVAINKHLIDDASTEEIISLHKQKNELRSKISTLQSNIDDVYNSLLTTDFTQNVTTSQSTLQSELQEYYTEKNELTSQFNDVVDNINTKANDSGIPTDGIKYRIRGIVDHTAFESCIQEIANTKCCVVGLDVEYRYKNTNSSTNKVTTIGNSTFTEWNKLDNINRERKLVFVNTGYGVEFVDYNTTDNIIKWNQIDIPITNGEDVIIRIRYKYNVGQPFINLYSPWSDNITVSFPTEYAEDVQINNILSQNETDTISAKFSKQLINGGYEEHIQDKTLANSKVFFHHADNIYSGFTTSENNLISLKDKLNQMVDDIDKYKSIIEQETNSKFDVYLKYDDNEIPLTSNTINNINIYNTEHIKDMYIRKNMNIIIKNTGDVPVKLYTLFAGDSSTSLIKSDVDSFNDTIGNYERIPVIINNELSNQKLGQWMYFRQTNPFTKEDIYYNNETQNIEDYLHENNDERLTFISKPGEYLGKNNKQALIGFKKRKNLTGNMDDIYRTSEETYAEAKRKSSYIDIITTTAYIEAIIADNVVLGDELKSFVTEYNDAASSTHYSYLVNGTVRSTNRKTGTLEIAVSYMMTKNINTGEISYDVTASQVFENSDQTVGYLNTPVSINIANKYVKSGEGLWSGAKVDYILKNPDDISKDYTVDEYVAKKIDESISKLVVSNKDYKYDYFYYKTDTDTSNNYLIKYEDICGTIIGDTTKKKYMLDETMTLSGFINNYSVDYFKDTKGGTTKFNGAFIFPNLLSADQILADAQSGIKTIAVGETASIPVVFEYFVDGTTQGKVSKSIYFDIKNSLISNPQHYMIEISGNYDYTATGDIYSDIDSI